MLNARMEHSTRCMLRLRVLMRGCVEARAPTHPRARLCPHTLPFMFMKHECVRVCLCAPYATYIHAQISCPVVRTCVRARNAVDENVACPVHVYLYECVLTGSRLALTKPAPHPNHSLQHLPAPPRRQAPGRPCDQMGTQGRPRQQRRQPRPRTDTADPGTGHASKDSLVPSSSSFNSFMLTKRCMLIALICI